MAKRRIINEEIALIKAMGDPETARKLRKLMKD